MARRLVRVQAPQIRPFANVDQITSANYRSYIDSTAGSNLRSPALAALQIPGGSTVDEDVAKIEVDATAAERILNDPTRRARQASPYDSAIQRYRGELLSVARSALEQRATQLEKIARGSFIVIGGRRSLVDTRPQLQEAQRLRAMATDEAQVEQYGMNLGGREATELQRLLPLQKSWDDQVNAGIVNPLSDQERASLQQQATTARNQIASINSAAAERLRNIATQFNDGTARAAAAIGDARRPLEGRFGTPATGVGIAIGGFR